MTLMPHQQQALQRLEESNGCQLLNLCPGAGKTLTALTYAKKFNKVLIVCPATITSVWRDEAVKWDMPEPILFQGTPKQRELIKKALQDKQDGSWLCVGYEMLLREWKSIQGFGWELVIFDESHRLKSPTAKIGKLVRKIAPSIPHRVLLSGTPIMNNIGDIWGQVTVVKSDSLYSNWYAFRSVHAIMPNPRIPFITGWRDKDGIMGRIKPYVFTIDKHEIQKNLPPVTSVDIQVELSPEEMRAYKQIKNEFLLQLEGQEELTIANALVQVGRLRQCADGLLHFGVEISSKLTALRELLDSLQDEKVIIFSMYSQVVHYFAQNLEIRHVVTGETKDKDRVIHEWKQSGTALIGTASLATGLNLQDAHYVVFIEPCWNKAQEDQSVGRAWRTGQKNPVTVYNLLGKDTIDYAIKKLILKKSSVANEVSSYTMADIRDMV